MHLFMNGQGLPKETYTFEERDDNIKLQETVSQWE